ncbi:hypothetical protein ACHAW5_010090 [Stephanodiscus triporus]|uniref:Uncharacterized protein n=1 Tax=Stephanodiscus triporus TaxID=2934178 RepID=A0ABD3NE52_9STRA
MMDVPAATSLLPAAKASGRCPPILIRDNAIVEGGVFEMAMLRALDQSQREDLKDFKGRVRKEERGGGRGPPIPPKTAKILAT